MKRLKMQALMNPTAWEMPAERLVRHFAGLCARVGSVSGIVDIVGDVNRYEARYFSGVITARLLGRDREMPFRRGDGVALKNQSADSVGQPLGARIRLQYETPVENPNRFVTIRRIPSDEPLIVRRVYFEDNDFLLEFVLPRIELTAPLLFRASDFLQARKVSGADGATVGA